MTEINGNNKPTPIIFAPDFFLRIAIIEITNAKIIDNNRNRDMILKIVSLFISIIPSSTVSVINIIIIE